MAGHSLLQRIFPTQGLNLGGPHCRQMLYRLSRQGSPSRAGKGSFDRLCCCVHPAPFALLTLLLFGCSVMSECLTLVADCMSFSKINIVFQLQSHAQLFATPWTAAHRACLSFTISWSLLKFMSFESVMPSNRLILCRPILLLSSFFPSIMVFSNESVLHIR